MKRFAAWFSRWQPVSAAAVIALIAEIADIVSSQLCNRVVGVYETNPWMRDEALHFVMKRGIIVKSIYGLMFLLLLWGVYHIAKLLSDTIARAVVAFLLLWVSVPIMLLALHNFLLALNWYQPGPEELMMRLLRP